MLDLKEVYSHGDILLLSNNNDDRIIDFYIIIDVTTNSLVIQKLGLYEIGYDDANQTIEYMPDPEIRQGREQRKFPKTVEMVQMANGTLRKWDGRSVTVRA